MRYNLICFFLLIYIFSSLPVYAQNNQNGELIIVDATISGLGKLVVSAVSSRGGQLIIVNYADCIEERRFLTETAISNLLVPNNDSALLLATSSNSIKSFDLLKSEQSALTDLSVDGNLRGLSQDKNGDLFAVWDNSVLKLFKFVKEPVFIWQAVPGFKITNVVPTSSNIYIAGDNGDFQIRAISGEILHTYSISKPILNMTVDEISNSVFIATGDSLIKYNGDSFTTITTLPTEKVWLNDKQNILFIKGNRTLTAFNYPSMIVKKTHQMVGNNVFITENGKIIIEKNKNTLVFTDANTFKIISVLYIYDNGIGMISSDGRLFGSDFFVSLVLNGKLLHMPLDVAYTNPDKNACNSMNAVLTNTFMPEKPTIEMSSSLTTPTVETVKSPVTNSVESAKPIQYPASPKSTTPVKQPQESTTKNVNGTNTPSVNTPKTEIKAPVLPTVNPVTLPALAQGNNIPSWVLNSSKLDHYSAVKSGGDSATALLEGKKKIREEITRSIMKRMLDVELVKNISNEDVKKRFLWMVSASTAQKAMERVMQKDIWLSKENLFYVWAFIDSVSVDAIYEPTFQSELDKLRSEGDEKYLQTPPIRW